VGALRPTSNRGELSAFYHALRWILSSRPPGPVPPRSFNILTDSEICVRLFADNPVKCRCSKELILIQRIRRGISLVKRHFDNLSIGWFKAHSTATTPEALGSAAADRLAGQGCAGLSHQMTQQSPFQARAPFSSPAWSSFVRVSCRRRRLRTHREPRLSPVYIAHLSAAQWSVFYQLAGFYRDRWPHLWPLFPPLPAGAGDVVGD